MLLVMPSCNYWPMWTAKATTKCMWTILFLFFTPSSLY